MKNMSRMALAIAVPFTVAGGVMLVPQAVSAHSNDSTADCTGIHAVASNYNPTFTNTITILLDGNVVYGPTQFNTAQATAEAAVPQDNAVHAWSVVVDSSEPGWDRTTSGSVGPCGEVIVTTTVIPTTTTTEAPTTTSTSTTEVTTSTSTTTTAPGTTTTAPVVTSTSTTSTVASTVPSTSTSLPGTTIPGTTTPSTLPSTTSTLPSTSTVPECVDNPNTPVNECAPICVVTYTDIDGDNWAESNSCDHSCRDNPASTDNECTRCDESNSTDTNFNGRADVCEQLPPTGAGKVILIMFLGGCALLVGVGVLIGSRRRKS